MTHEDEASLRAAAVAWDRAMVHNDADAIGRFMAEEWTIIGSDGSISDRAGFLALIRDGRLTHHEMTTEQVRVQCYGEVGILVARGISAGLYEGSAFREIERQSNVFVRRAGEWRCVLTHLSKIKQEVPAA